MNATTTKQMMNLASQCMKMCFCRHCLLTSLLHHAWAPALTFLVYECGKQVGRETYCLLRLIEPEPVCSINSARGGLPMSPCASWASGGCKLTSAKSEVILPEPVVAFTCTDVLPGKVISISPEPV